MSISISNTLAVLPRWRGSLPIAAAASAYLLCLFNSDALLRDSDTLWQIKVGQWMLDHHAVPYTDVYSFTRFGAPWISSSWLSQILFAASYSALGWAGPVLLTSIAFAAAVAVLVRLLDKHLEPIYSALFAILAATLTLQHLLARPHILALPVMVAWLGVLLSAAERRVSPSFLALPLIALWANLHGSFVLGLALMAPIALEALWCAAPKDRTSLAYRWALFALAALAATCCTPYYWRTLLGAAEILSLGQVLSLIAEWAPVNFQAFDPFEIVLIGLIGFGFYAGMVLSLPRVILLLGLTWMALTHVRHIEVFAFVAPLVLARPLAEQLLRSGVARTSETSSPSVSPAWITPALAAVVLATTISYAFHHHFAFAEWSTPGAAVDVLKERKAQRVFNTYGFGGYLIWRDMRPFIDSRAELYGEKFVMDVFNAQEVHEPEGLLHMLDEYRIDATLLEPSSPAARMLDYLPGWRRAYADKLAVIHLRDGTTGTSALQPAPANGRASYPAPNVSK